MTQTNTSFSARTLLAIGLVSVMLAACAGNTKEGWWPEARQRALPTALPLVVDAAKVDACAADGVPESTAAKVKGQVVMVPETAVFTYRDRTTVALVEADFTVRFREIAAAEPRCGFRVVEHGLGRRDLLVVAGAGDLWPGASVMTVPTQLTLNQ